MSNTRDRITDMALEAGFDLVGFGPPSPAAETARRFDAWIDAGRHGDMAWLAKNRERIVDASRYVTGVRGAIALGFEYSGEAAAVGEAKLARYAAGRDYHRALGKRLERLHAGLDAEGIGAGTLRHGVDAVPILERSLAAQAGIGFLAKSSGIIHPSHGPWLLLAEVLHGEDIEPSGPARGSCGTCTACLDACPTQAIVADHQVDARRCLSYTTIEKRGLIDWELRSPQADWLFGCDVCIEVCPFTSRAKRRRADDTDLALHPAVETYTLVGVLDMSIDDWNRDWTGTAVRRAKREGLRRNAAIVAANLGLEAATPSLRLCLADADPGVRSAAAWALAKLGTERRAIEDALAREGDALVRADIERSLEAFAHIG